ncbi:hypothetical protein QAD02_010356 [Eretmocerus hayati]|uniref:Uncharacterized protein n=1 Tax=Eretmocerus hayati TaxID=131215 RepID=A0ACC2NC73_9HYME|nr:hypothetical protein QAD02_010356 [Eretmocerus hayati]
MKYTSENILFLALNFAVVAAIPPQDSRREELSAGIEDTCDHPEQCGPNSDCRMLLGLPMCRCLPDFVGSPPSCSRRCLDDLDCPDGEACLSTNRRGRAHQPLSCSNPCSESCGLNAECKLVGKRAQCTCPKGWFGDPATICRECNSHADCPADRPACIFEISCENQCEGLCGVYAHCRIATNNATGQSMPVCSCPEGRTGNPFEYCRPITQVNPCQPSPCGPNTDCRPTRDYAYARCGCLPGYFGDPRSAQGCELGQDCVVDDDCPENRACVDSLCQNPCVDPDIECPPSQPSCVVLDHKAVCRSKDCPPGAAAVNSTVGSDCGSGPNFAADEDVFPQMRREAQPRAITSYNNTFDLTA